MVTRKSEAIVQLSIHGKESTDIANFIEQELEIGSYHPNQVDFDSL